VLEREGYLVLTATTGTEALAILQREQVCLVLSNHMLRGTTGVAAVWSKDIANSDAFNPFMIW
jgi:CheY-like chemotaxis protein